MTTLWQDVRYGVRMLRSNPGLTVVAVFSLALGIGVNTGIFSVVNGVLLKCLPVRDPHELRVIEWTGKPALETFFDRDDRSNRSLRAGGTSYGAFSYPAYERFVKEAKGFSHLFAFSAFRREDEAMTINVGSVASTARGLMVSGNFFDGYGVGVLLGRSITPQDERPDAEPVTVIAYRTWQRYYGLDPHVLGKIFTVNNIPFTIVGVLPRHCRGPLPADPTEFYIPLTTPSELWPDRNVDWLTREDFWYTQIMGRLTPGADEAQARASLEVPFRRLLSDSEVQIEQPAISVVDGRYGLTTLREEMSRPLLLLQAVVGVVLLIACVNLAGLLLARGVARRHEMAVRAALGAGPRRLIRQSLAESLVLSLAGAGVGLVVSVWINAAVGNLLLGPMSASHLDLRIDLRVLAFTLALSVVTALLSGFLTALQAGGVDASAGLKNADLRSAPRLGLGQALVVGQVGLSVLLVMGAGLLTRSLVNFYRINLGFDAQNILVFQLSPLETAYKRQDRGLLFESVRQAVAQIPGVRSVAFCRNTLLDKEIGRQGIAISDRPSGGGLAFGYVVSDGWFAAMGIGLLSGRDFGPMDTPGSQRVAIINQAFARQFFPQENPLGRRFRAADDKEYQIVGVCRDHVARHLREGSPAVMYFCHQQKLRDFKDPRTAFVVRSVLPPLSLVPAVRQAAASIGPNLPLSEATTQAELLESDIAKERLFGLLCGGLALLALTLSCLGVYGLVAYHVNHRTREMGIRMALGARPRDVAWPILREALILTALGIALGLPVALVLVRVVRHLLYEVKPHDPLTIVGTVGIMVAVAVLAAWIPARRAARIDPMAALRYE
jgi:predicted permease